jgi:sigma-B regulation protein RsbU (phosphoserine phosphatase)
MNMPAAGNGPALTQHAVTVLLVDDQPIVAEAVRRMLAPEADIVFHYCQDPSKALPTALEIRPTIILQDLVMPEMDGITVVKFFRRHPELKDVPLIVLSSKEEAVTKAEAFAAGASDYLVKLPDRIELVARIRHHSGGYIHLLERNEAHAKLVKSQQALAEDLQRASEYVMSLLPKPVAVGPVETEWRYVPCAHLGGDSFGHHWVDPDHFALYLLDVCGHGVGSALLSVSALNALRSQSLPNVDFRDPAAVLAAMNEAFPMSRNNGLFFTLWYGVYDRAARTLRYSSGGHPPAMLRSGDGNVAQLMTSNPIIGAFPKVKYQSDATAIAPGATLYVFSDGVYEVERPDGSMWTLKELGTYLAAPPADEIDVLYANLREMRGEETLEDDFSMLRLRFA